MILSPVWPLSRASLGGCPSYFFDSVADGGVAFGQLLGMCDHVTFPLGARGYNALKVVPYGPIRSVRLVRIQWLVLRACGRGALADAPRGVKVSITLLR